MAESKSMSKGAKITIGILIVIIFTLVTTYFVLRAKAGAPAGNLGAKYNPKINSGGTGTGILGQLGNNVGNALGGAIGTYIKNLANGNSNTYGGNIPLVPDSSFYNGKYTDDNGYTVYIDGQGNYVDASGYPIQVDNNGNYIPFVGNTARGVFDHCDDEQNPVDANGLYVTNSGQCGGGGTTTGGECDPCDPEGGCYSFDLCAGITSSVNANLSPNRVVTITDRYGCKTTTRFVNNVIVSKNTTC